MVYMKNGRIVNLAFYMKSVLIYFSKMKVITLSLNAHLIFNVMFSYNDNTQNNLKTIPSGLKVK